MPQDLIDDESTLLQVMAWWHQETSRLLQMPLPELVFTQFYAYIDGLVQERRNSSALAMELHLSCTDPSI